MITLYHFTSEHGFTGMVQTGKIKSSAAIASSDAEVNHGKVFFISATRTRKNAYSKEHTGVMLTLDGTKLKQKYKTAPVDYWQDTNYSEAEERILTNKPDIPLWPYVKEVAINLKNFTDISNLRKAVMKCKLHKVPVYLFSNSNDMFLNAKHKRVNIADVDLSFMKPHSKAFHAEPRHRPYMEPILVLAHALNTPRFEKAKTSSKAVVDLAQQIHDYARYGDTSGIYNMLSSELNLALRRGGRSYLQAISLLKLLTDRKMTLEGLAKQLGVALQY